MFSLASDDDNLEFSNFQDWVKWVHGTCSLNVKFLGPYFDLVEAMCILTLLWDGLEL